MHAKATEALPARLPSAARGTATVSLRRFRPHDIGTEISKQFPTIDAALVGQIDDPHILQGAGGLRHGGQILTDSRRG